MTDQNEIAALKQAVEGLHNCRATYERSEPVIETFRGETVWAGEVAIFAIEGATAPRAYAWSHEAEAGKRRFHAVLAVPPVNTPLDAVRAAIAAEARRN